MADIEIVPGGAGPAVITLGDADGGTYVNPQGGVVSSDAGGGGPPPDPDPSLWAPRIIIY